MVARGQGPGDDRHAACDQTTRFRRRPRICEWSAKPGLGPRPTLAVGERLAAACEERTGQVIIVIAGRQLLSARSKTQQADGSTEPMKRNTVVDTFRGLVDPSSPGTSTVCSDPACKDVKGKVFMSRRECSQHVCHERVDRGEGDQEYTRSPSQRRQHDLQTEKAIEPIALPMTLSKKHTVVAGARSKIVQKAGAGMLE